MALKVPPPRPSHAFAGLENELTPTDILKPFLISQDVRDMLNASDMGQAILEIQTKQTASLNGSIQKLWQAARSNDRKLDANNRLMQRVVEISEQNSVTLGALGAKLEGAIEAREAESEARKQGDAELAEYVGNVIREISRNSSADLERDLRVQHVEIQSKTALDTATTAQQAIVPLSAHGKRQIGIVGFISALATLVNATKEPLIAYAKMRGWL